MPLLRHGHPEERGLQQDDLRRLRGLLLLALQPGGGGLRPLPCRRLRALRPRRDPALGGRAAGPDREARPLLPGSPPLVSSTLQLLHTAEAHERSVGYLHLAHAAHNLGLRQGHGRDEPWPGRLHGHGRSRIPCKSCSVLSEHSVAGLRLRPGMPSGEMWAAAGALAPAPRAGRTTTR